MKDSVTYQAIIREGREEGRAEGRMEALKGTILRLGAKRFGPPSVMAVTTVEAITDADRLIALCDRLLNVESWDELLEVS